MRQGVSEAVVPAVSLPITARRGLVGGQGEKDQGEVLAVIRQVLLEMF